MNDNFNAFRDKMLNLKVTKCDKIDSETLIIGFEDKTKFEVTNTIYHDLVVTKLE